MEELIKRMERDGKNIYILKSYYEVFKDSISSCKRLSREGLPVFNSKYYEQAEKYFDKLHGYIWALCEIGYIDGSCEESIFNELIELIDMISITE